MLMPYDWLMLDIRLDTLRKDKRFGKILSESRAHFLEMLRFIDDARDRHELPPYLEQPLKDLRTKLEMP